MKEFSTYNNHRESIYCRSLICTYRKLYLC